MPPTTDAEDAAKHHVHALIDRAFDMDTDTRVVLLVYENQNLSVQSVGVNNEELRNIMFHSSALLEGATTPHPEKLQ